MNTCIPKLCGSDIELGNFVLGIEDPAISCAYASRALLKQIEGFASGGSSREDSQYSSRAQQDPQDWGRKFLSSGACVYIDLNHLELCTPEVISAFDHVACWHAMLRIAQRALARANELQPKDRPIQALVNNCDNAGNSYGAHLNFLVSREMWDNLFIRRMHHMLYLAAYQTSAILFGQGKVRSQNGRPPVAYQISQRADFMETLTGAQTTFNRPIVNSRDEALCGVARYGESLPLPVRDYARLHVIFFDSTLCHLSCLLRIGVTQLILTMLEAGSINPSLILDDPLDALVRWSHDPSLKSRARLADGREVTAVELQLLFLEEAEAFAEGRGFHEAVPRADEILEVWRDTLLKLHRRDFSALTGIDWILKLQILDRAREMRPDLDWTSTELMHLDQMYSSLDPTTGLYWQYERQGLTKRIIAEENIEYFTANPPEDTRAWTRAMLLRAAGFEGIDSVNWDRIEFRIPRPYWSSYRRLNMFDPLSFTRSVAERHFLNNENLAELLDALEALNAAHSCSYKRKEMQ